jgi:TPR repeat protein
MASKNGVREKRIFLETLKSARIGIAEAQYEVGLMYANGIGVAKNVDAAIEWIKKSADRGLQSAQYLLETRYAMGVGVSRDISAAHHWFSKASQQGHLKAHLKLAKIYAVGQPEMAESLIAKAAESGLAEAQLEKGLDLLYGRAGALVNIDQAAHWLTLAAQQGSAQSQFQLANLLLKRGSTEDIEQALHWYRMSVRQGYAAAQVALEKMDLDGFIREKRGRGSSRARNGSRERRQNESRWEKIAENGNPETRYQVGVMHELGLGLPLNRAKAEYWYASAAALGDARAQFALGVLLEDTQIERAMNLYRDAAAQGHIEAQFAYGRLQLLRAPESTSGVIGLPMICRAAEQGHAEALLHLARMLKDASPGIAFSCCREAAALGSAEGQFLLGQHFQRGLGVVANFSTAFYWYSLSAGQGNMDAQCELAALYLRGLGVGRDVGLAMAWFQRAAEQGCAAAQWNLGALFAGGSENVQPNLRLAFEWCQLAAAQNFLAAQASLGLLFARMKDYKKARAWWLKAADRGDPEAQYNLAMLCKKGDGGDKNLEMAFRYFLMAADSGLVEAQSRIGLMYSAGEGVAKDGVEGYRWLLLADRGGDAIAAKNRANADRLLLPEQIREAVRRADAWKSP